VGNRANQFLAHLRKKVPEEDAFVQCKFYGYRQHLWRACSAEVNRIAAISSGPN